MFTGIVGEIGTVRHAGPNASGLRLEIASSAVAQDLGIDASVNVAGACLTVVERDTHGFTVDLVAETLARTTLGRAIRGTRVNLESAATPTTVVFGDSAFTAVATPAMRPPPPTGTTTQWRSGSAATISRPTVPWPRITAALRGAAGARPLRGDEGIHHRGRRLAHDRGAR